MRVLDLFCGGGGAAMGYAQAGFEVVGVDKRDQPDYPFAFHRANALEFDISGFDLVHASPPCQFYSRSAWQRGTAHGYPDLVGPVRAMLTDVPYVIENITEAPLRDPIVLCGTMFDLGVFRHRGFETNWGLRGPKHQKHVGRVGDGRYVTVAGHTGGWSRRDGIQHGRLVDWQRAMDIDWLGAESLAEAIPPAYTRFIGDQFKQRMRHGS